MNGRLVRLWDVFSPEAEVCPTLSEDLEEEGQRESGFMVVLMISQMVLR